MTSALVLLAPGFEEIEAVTPIDVLRRAGVEVTTLAVPVTTLAGPGEGVSELEVPGAHGLRMRCDATLAQGAELAAQADLVVLPGGMPGSKHLGESAPVQALLQSLSAETWVGAICAAPALGLAPSGLLGGHRATCYPGFEAHFPADVEFVEERVVIDGKRITSRGPGTALEFALALVEQVVGPDAAAQLRAGMLAA